MKRKPPAPPRISRLEAEFDNIWRVLKPDGPVPVAEYVFAHPRRWRFDRAFVEERVAVELEGGVWTRGRHQRPAGFIGDLEKYNAAALGGWLVLRFCADDLRRDPRRVVDQVMAAVVMRRAA